MKLLSWMHWKLQKNNTGSLNGSAVGNSCLSLKPSFNNQDDFKAEDTVSINGEESTEIFPGFLTIGTLSMEPVTEPPTPTFDLPLQIEDKDGTAEMQYDLKLITEELEKFLRREAENEGNNEPSGRKSHESDVTLIDKEKEEVDDYKYIDMHTHPLQGYLLASSTELYDTKQKENQEWTSLQEMFQNSITADKSSSMEAEDPKKKEKKKLKSSACVMNKKLQTHQPYNNNFTASTGCGFQSSSTMKKLSKIKRLFRKKIHPDISTAEQDPNKFSNNKSSKILNIPSHSYADSTDNFQSIRMGCWGILIKAENHHSKADKKQLRNTRAKGKLNIALNDKTSNASKEHWINTDEDYLVLELQQNEAE